MTVAPGSELGLYSDLAPEDAATFAPLFAPHSQDAFETSVDYIVADALAAGLPLAYIVTEQDLAFPPDAQRALAARVPGMLVESIATSHSPFASQPVRLAEMVIAIAESRK
jgi:pimeloyl-ACP methyl ester carboxylesterase